MVTNLLSEYISLIITDMKWTELLILPQAVGPLRNVVFMATLSC